MKQYLNWKRLLLTSPEDYILHRHILGRLSCPRNLHSTLGRAPSKLCDTLCCSVSAAVSAAFAVLRFCCCLCAWNSQEINTINTLIANFRLRYFFFFSKFRHWDKDAPRLPGSFVLSLLAAASASSPAPWHSFCFNLELLQHTCVCVCVLQIHIKRLWSRCRLRLKWKQLTL